MRSVSEAKIPRVSGGTETRTGRKYRRVFKDLTRSSKKGGKFKIRKFSLSLIQKKYFRKDSVCINQKEKTVEGLINAIPPVRQNIFSFDVSEIEEKI